MIRHRRRWATTLLTGTTLAALTGCGSDPEPGAVAVSFQRPTEAVQDGRLVTPWAFIRISGLVTFGSFARPYRYALSIDGAVVDEGQMDGARLAPDYVWDTVQTPAGSHTVTLTGSDAAGGQGSASLEFDLIDQPGIVEFELANPAPEGVDVYLLDAVTEAEVARAYVENPFDVATAEFGPDVFTTPDGFLEALPGSVIVEVRWSDGGNDTSERLGEVAPAQLASGVVLMGTGVVRLHLAGVRFGSSDPASVPGRPFCDYAPFC